LEEVTSRLEEITHNRRWQRTWWICL